MNYVNRFNYYLTESRQVQINVVKKNDILVESFEFYYFTKNLLNLQEHYLYIVCKVKLKFVMHL